MGKTCTAAYSVGTRPAHQPAEPRACPAALGSCPRDPLPKPPYRRRRGSRGHHRDPQGSRNKYELDSGSGRIRLDRKLFTSTRYPADYGFIPGTLAEDGDPLDAMVLLGEPAFPGSVITARPVSIFWMTDEHGPGAKILAVPAHDPRCDSLRDLPDIPAHLRAEISHFFDVYKELEPGKAPTSAAGRTVRPPKRKSAPPPTVPALRRRRAGAPGPPRTTWPTETPELRSRRIAISSAPSPVAGRCLPG
jgi:inorganic pyrophosphatase